MEAADLQIASGPLLKAIFPMEMHLPSAVLCECGCEQLSPELLASREAGVSYEQVPKRKRHSEIQLRADPLVIL